MSLREVADELYALPPDRFIAARNSRVKEARAADDRALATQVAALRRPSTAAWAVNLLVRRHPEEIGGLLTLGGQLRTAQAALAGDELRALNRQQHQLMAAVVRRVTALAREDGVRLTAAVTGQVEGTLRAAMSDPDAAAAVLSGLLVGDLTSSGFEPVTLDGAVAVPADGSRVPGRGADPAPARSRPRSVPQRAGLRAVPDLPGPAGPAKARAERAAVEQAARTVARQAAERANRAQREAAEQRALQEAAIRRQEVARRRQEAEEDVRLAAHDASVAETALVAARDRVAHVEARSAALAQDIQRTTERVAELTQELARLREETRAATRDSRAARSTRQTADRAATAARRRAQSANDRLGRL